MNIENWEARLKKTRKSVLTTGRLAKVKHFKGTNKYQIEGKEGKLRVVFENPHRLTIFEADLLYLLFIENKLPLDYANYHKCIAGKHFIENIKYFEFPEITETWILIGD